MGLFLTVPLLLQLLQAAVVAVPAHTRQPSPGEDATALGASSCTSRSSGGWAGGGRRGQRRSRPGLKACRVQAHLCRTDQYIKKCVCGYFICVCVYFVCFFNAHPSVSQWAPAENQTPLQTLLLWCPAAASALPIWQDNEELNHSKPMRVFTQDIHSFYVLIQTRIQGQIIMLKKCIIIITVPIIFLKNYKHKLPVLVHAWVNRLGVLYSPRWNDSVRTATWRELTTLCLFSAHPHKTGNGKQEMGSQCVRKGRGTQQ